MNCLEDFLVLTGGAITGERRIFNQPRDDEIETSNTQGKRIQYNY